MKFEEREFTLKDGRKCILKPTAPEYAAEMIEYLKNTAAETPFLLRNPDEVSFTVEGEKDILGRLYEDPYCIMMMPIVEGKVAGNGSINGIGDKRKIRHRCSLAIALYKEYWGLGIGTAMINYMTELAAQIGWHQVDLEVVAENSQAQALYKKCGFIESGRRHNALRFDDGTYHDEILMYKELEHKV
ncbi:MAG: GNAT family N-acetyltransferase [Lachnospiraceae bacterium]|nr:GNAT family N-acetyltransferase [Lachnospiraceae bacterium]